MAFLSEVLVSLLLTSTALAMPTGNGMNALPWGTLRKRQSGGNVGVAYNGGGGWLLTANIGGQDVTLNIDTGSSDLWTASNLLPENEQAFVTTGQIYDASQTQRLNGSTFNIQYGDKSGASGPVGVATVSLGSASVPNMPFGMASSLTLSPNQESRDTDGPVGLAFPGLNMITPQQQCTFISCLLPYLSDPVFSTDFKTDSSGSLAFGSSDSSAYSGDLTTVGIDNSGSQWAAQASFGSGGQTLGSGDEISMLFDTGTPALAIPSDAAASYFDLVDGGTSGPDANGWYTFDCSSQLPDFDYVFADGTVTVPGSSIVQTSSGSCNTWIQNVGDQGFIGMPMFSSKYIIWNPNDPSVSIADQA